MDRHLLNLECGAGWRLDRVVWTEVTGPVSVAKAESCTRIAKRTEPSASSAAAPTIALICSATTRKFDGDAFEEGRKVLVHPELLGHAEFKVSFGTGTATLVFTHRESGGKNIEKQGWE